jgi:hypothetical protein
MFLRIYFLLQNCCACHSRANARTHARVRIFFFRLRLMKLSLRSELSIPLWSSGQSTWPQIQRSRFDSRRYHIFFEVVGLERGPLSLVSTIEELLERNIRDTGLQSREYGRRDPSRWPRGTLYPEKLALTSPTSGSRSVGVVRSRTQSTEFNKQYREWIQLGKYVHTSGGGGGSQSRNY